MKKVLIGAPVRNRGWVLQRHLNALLTQKGFEKEFLYIVNDSVDNTEEILKKNNIPYITYNLNSKRGHKRGQYSYENLAILRNKLLDEFLKTDCDYLFSVDTDVIIPEKDSIKQLIDDNKDIISMLIRNHPKIFAHNVMENGRHLNEIPKGVFPIDLTGAVYLIKRKVIESGVKYGAGRSGEDEIFCKQAREKGFGIYCDSRLKPIHAYDKGVDLIGETII